MAIISHWVRENGSQSTMDSTGLWRDRDDDATAHVLERLRAAGRSRRASPRKSPPALHPATGAGCAQSSDTVQGNIQDALFLLRANELEFGDTRILEGVLPTPAHDPSWGWSALAEHGCTVQTLDGHHTTLLQPPTVEAVAYVVRQAALATTEVGT